MIVVDSSVLIAFFRGHQNPAVVAQLVLEVDGTLLHNDDDFEAIAKVRPLLRLL